MKIGYSAWGFIGDGVIDSPDGGRITRALFIEHLLKNGHEVIWLQQNRDIEDNEPIFCEENKVKFDGSKKNDEQRKILCDIEYSTGLPDIDVLFLEWRWKIPGRNCDVDKDSDKYTPDLDRQTELLMHYLREKNKICIWDKDETLTSHNEETFSLLKKKNNELIVFSPALFPIQYLYERTTLLFPCDLSKIEGTKVNYNDRGLLYDIGYVGSQYERDEQVYKYINPVARNFKVTFVGNWMKYPEKIKRNQINFPDIVFHDRILPKDMWQIYKECMTSVLLCKSNYAAHGHITQRIHETVSNGVINIGLREQKGIENFISDDLLINDAYDLAVVLNKLKKMSREERQIVLDKQIECLKPFDINNVMKVFEESIKDY